VIVGVNKSFALLAVGDEKGNPFTNEAKAEAVSAFMAEDKPEYTFLTIRVQAGPTKKFMSPRVKRNG